MGDRESPLDQTADSYHNRRDMSIDLFEQELFRLLHAKEDETSTKNQLRKRGVANPTQVVDEIKNIEINNLYSVIEQLLAIKDPWRPPTPSESTNLWRYVDFTQFISVIEHECLWFTNMDEFDDPYEGIVPLKNIEGHIENIRNRLNVSKDMAIGVYEIVLPHFKLDSTLYVNSWHANEYESAALWSQYLESGQGVAIKTDTRKLRNALSQDDWDVEIGFDSSISSEQVIIGEIDYIDYQNDDIPDGDISLGYHKRRSFEHENEVRISFEAPIVDNSGMLMYNILALNWISDNLRHGAYVPIELDILVDEIYVAPTSKQWHYDLIKQILDTHSIDCSVRQSEIDSSPAY